MIRVPIRLRVAAAFAVAMALVLVATGIFLYTRLGSHLSTAVDRDLRLRAQDLAAVAGDPRSSLAATSTGLVEHGESYAQVIDADGRILDATKPLAREPLLDQDEIARALGAPFFAERARVPGLDERSRFLATRVVRADRPAVLVVGTTLEDRAETLAELRDELLIAGPVALLLASLAGYLLAGVALRPVEVMRARAAAISAARPRERLPVPATGDELERLGRTLNAMLDRLEAFLERERDFLADAGHELRTPLAALRTELELALRHGGSAEQMREAMSRALGEVERLARLADDLLLIARADRGALELQLEELSVAELFETVVRRFERRALELGKELRPVETRRRVRGDRLRLEQALANLVDNALEHGGDEILLVAADAEGGAVSLGVHDNGAGFPDGFAGEAFERFSRADPARTAGGSDLGLAIVQTIASAHSGVAQIENSPEGTLVLITLPG